MKLKNRINGQRPEFGNIDQIKVLQEEERVRKDKQEYANLSESDRIENAFIGIDMNRYFINECLERYSKALANRSPLEIILDKATGYEKSVIKGYLTELKLIYKMQVHYLKVVEHIKQAEEYQLLLNKVNEGLKRFKPIRITKIEKETKLIKP